MKTHWFCCCFLLGFVRLAAGDGPCSGRVEVYSGEAWIPVSDRNFTLPTAQVICAELGCGKAVSVLGHELFRESSARVWAEQFRCEGEEPELRVCPRVPCPGGTCHHSGAAQVVCSGEMQVRPFISVNILFKWEIMRFCWNSVFFYQHTQKSGSWQTAPLNVRGRYRWTFLDDGEHSVPLTGVWPMPMLSVVSLAVESPSPLPEDHTLRKEVIRSQQSNFTAQGLSPSCRAVLWLPWVVLTVPMATRPLWSAQIREREGLLVLRMLLEWNVPSSREGGKIGFES